MQRVKVRQSLPDLRQVAAIHQIIMLDRKASSESDFDCSAAAISLAAGRSWKDKGRVCNITSECHS